VILSQARATARRYARRHPLGLCTVEEVYERLARRGRDLGCLARIAGNIFRTPQWHKTFLRLASRRPAARGREVKVWRLTRSEVEAGAPFGWSVVVDGLDSSTTDENGVGGENGCTQPLVSCDGCDDVVPASLATARSREVLCAPCRERRPSEDEQELNRP
jgi:hypothetical protein